MANRFSPIRHRRRRPLKRVILVVCDGEATEPNYFNGLKSRDDIAIRYTIKICHAGSRDSRADAIKNGIAHHRPDEVWCVFDTECPASRAKVDDINRIAASSNAQVVWSNPSFESWVL